MIKKRIEIKKKIKVILEKHHLSALLPHMHSPLIIVSIYESINICRLFSHNTLVILLLFIDVL